MQVTQRSSLGEERTSTVMGGSGIGVSLLMTVSPMDTSEIPVIITISPVTYRRKRRESNENYVGGCCRGCGVEGRMKGV